MGEKVTRVKGKSTPQPIDLTIACRVYGASGMFLRNSMAHGSFEREGRTIEFDVSANVSGDSLLLCTHGDAAHGDRLTVAVPLKSLVEACLARWEELQGIARKDE